MVAAQVADQCTAGNQGQGTFPEGVERFVMTMKGDGVDFQVDVPNALDSAGEILVQHVPPGENLTLDLYGCNAENALTWSARAVDVSVTKNHKTSPGLYLTKKDVFNCPGSSLESIYDWRSDLDRGHVFGASVATANNGVLITGGFDTAAVGDAELLLTTDDNGSKSIIEYQATKGLFRTWDGVLNHPRGLHHAVAFDSGHKVMVVGGVRSAVSGPSAPVRPTRLVGSDGYDPTLLPAQPFEVIDLKTETVTGFDINAITASVLPLSAMTTNKYTESLVLTGGIQTNGEPSNHVIYLPNITTALNNPNAPTSAFSGLMNVGRMGHSMVPLNDDGRFLFVLGGNFEPEGAVNGGSLAEMIALPTALDGSQNITAHPIQNNSEAGISTQATAFHEVVLLEKDTTNCTARFMVAGGLGVVKSTSQQYTYLPLPPAIRLDQIDLTDTCIPESVAMTITPLVILGVRWLFTDPDQMRRVLHDLTDLGGGSMLLTGGFSNMSKNDIAFCDAAVQDSCFFADSVEFQYESGVVSIANHTPALTLSHARMGHDTVVLSDGTLLVMGGLRCITDPNCLEGDAEIFNPIRSNESSICIPPAPVVE